MNIYASLHVRTTNDMRNANVHALIQFKGFSCCCIRILKWFTECTVCQKGFRTILSKYSSCECWGVKTDFIFYINDTLKEHSAGLAKLSCRVSESDQRSVMFNRFVFVLLVKITLTLKQFIPLFLKSFLVTNLSGLLLFRNLMESRSFSGLNVCEALRELNSSFNFPPLNCVFLVFAHKLLKLCHQNK